MRRVEMNGRIAVLIPDYNVCYSLTVLNTAVLIAEKGYEVEIITNRSLYGCPIIEGVKFYSQSENRAGPKYNIDTERKNWLSKVAHLVEKRLGHKPGICKLVEEFRRIWSWKGLYSFIRWACSICTDKQYICFIGCDPHGLVSATILGRRFKVPVAYHSLELHLWQEARTPGTIIEKLVERWFNRQCVFTIIQDKNRAQYLIKENAVPESQIVLLPVAGLGNASQEKQNFLRSKFNIPADKLIILQLGGIFEWNMCLELAKAAWDLPDNCFFVLHGFSYDENYIGEILKTPMKNNFIISMEPVPMELVDNLVASADIGVALYRNTGPNHYYVGSASGKLVHYLKNGLPVVVTNFSSLREIVEYYRCGVCIDNASGLYKAVQTILKDYKTYSDRAIKCYHERYDARLYIPNVLKRIEALESVRNI